MSKGMTFFGNSIKRHWELQRANISMLGVVAYLRGSLLTIRSPRVGAYSRGGGNSRVYGHKQICVFATTSDSQIDRVFGRKN